MLLMQLLALSISLIRELYKNSPSLALLTTGRAKQQYMLILKQKMDVHGPFIKAMTLLLLMTKSVGVFSRCVFLNQLVIRRVIKSYPDRISFDAKINNNSKQ